MSREVRRVPKDWQHPKDERGNYVPLFGQFSYSEEEIAEGIRDGWLNKYLPNYGVDVMPQWKEEEKTHLQMYETCTEGTPISPIFATPEELARWLADNKASVFGGMTATYEQWLSTCKRGWAASAVISNNTMVSGVEGLDKLHKAQ